MLDSFNYYIGMAENAILYIREASDIINDDILERLVISHKRFYKEMTLLDYYDPTSLIIDYRSRDIAEFLKFSFICKEYDFLLIKDYLYSHKLSRFGAHLLFGRLLFPSFYFDTLEEWLHSNDDGFIRILEERIYEYEMYILEIFSILHDMYNIKEVNWLTKKM